jgi:hypothetical protein
MRVSISAEGWAKARRFLVLPYVRVEQDERPEQYQRFDTTGNINQVFVTDLESPLDRVVCFYKQLAADEDFINEVNNDTGLELIRRPAGS